jgi:hypothetical protein
MVEESCTQLLPNNCMNLEPDKVAGHAACMATRAPWPLRGPPLQVMLVSWF